MGSRLSDKSRLFNKLYWEPLNSEGFRKLSYNACDQAASELHGKSASGSAQKTFLSSPRMHGPRKLRSARDLSVSSTPSPITGLWLCTLPRAVCTPMQTPSSFLGYKALRGMDKNALFARYRTVNLHTGHYVDHEFVSNLGK